MPIAIPQIVTEDRASGAPLIEGSLLFDEIDEDYLRWTPNQTGNRVKWTYSVWAKVSEPNTGDYKGIFGFTDGGPTNYSCALWSSNGRHLQWWDSPNGGNSHILETNAYYIDHAGWYHIVYAADYGAGNNADKMKIYVNGVEAEYGVDNRDKLPAQGWVNSDSVSHEIGSQYQVSTSRRYDGFYSQAYFIDGQTLGPEHFAFLDPLTHSWRPKKYTGTYGQNGFYLPFDGNTPIGKDQSGGPDGYGVTWSKYFVGHFAEATPTEIAFDGLTSGWVKTDNNTTCTFTPPNPIPYSTSVEVHTSYAGTVTLNGGSPVTVADLNQWETIHSGSGNLTSLVFTSSASVWLKAIRVDGTILTNPNNWTSEEFGGTTSISKATGALPIFNTTGAGRSAGVGLRPDPLAANLVLALPLIDGHDSKGHDYSADIKGSGTTKTVAVTGAITSPMYSNFYGNSYFFDGSDDTLDVTSHADFTFNTDDYTIELWFFSYGSSCYLIDWGAGNVNSIWHDGTWVYFHTNVGSGNPSNSKIGKFSSKKWHHVAVSRKNGTIYKFLDGVKLPGSGQDGGSEDCNANYSALALRIGGYQGAGYKFHGYLQDVRVYKGVAKYVDDFSPASADKPTIYRESPSTIPYKAELPRPITGGIVGRGNGGNTIFARVDADGHTDNTLDGDFTIEWWHYKAEHVSGNGFMMTVGDSNTATGIELYYGSGGGTILKLYTNGSPNEQLDARAKTGWSHYAVVRSGSTITTYLDGQANSQSITNSNTFSGNIHIGAEYYNGSVTGGTAGPISNFRLVKGTAVYTSNFTPSTKPLQAITNTKILCCQSTIEAGAAAVSPHMGGVNNGTQWSAYLSTNAIMQNATQGFDANMSTRAQTTANSAGYTFTFAPPAITFSSKLEIYTDQGSSGGTPLPTAVWNGNTVTPGQGAWVTIYNGSGTISSDYPIVINTNGASQYATLKGIRVDNVILRDPIAVTDHLAPTTFNPFAEDNSVQLPSGSFATLNPQDVTSTSNATMKHGNTSWHHSASNNRTAGSNVRITSGMKVYWEIDIHDTGDTNTNATCYNGIIQGRSVKSQGTLWIGGNNSSWGFDIENTGRWKHNNGTVGESIYSNRKGMTMMYCIDYDAGKVWCGTNGGWFGGGNPSLGTNPSSSNLNTSIHSWIHPVVMSYKAEQVMNFGQRPFKYAPPEGFGLLTTGSQRKPDKIQLTNPRDYFVPLTYTGNGVTAGKEVPVPFKPDFVWSKNITTAYHHRLWDSVRGWDKALYANNEQPENNWTDYGYPVQVTDTYVKVGQGTNSNMLVNVNNSNYGLWCWKAGGGSGAGGEFWKDDIQYANAAAAGLSGGSITPTAASIGTKQGFSIIKYTGNGTSGSTVPHGLLEAPTFILTKALNQSGGVSVGWGVFHVGGSYSGSMLYLMQGTSAANDTNVYTTTTQTNNHFTIGDWGGINQNGTNYISYCWHNVDGLQRFGSYTGNGDADGPYIDLGFRPAMVAFKNTTGNHWGHLDTARDTYSPLKNRLHWNTYDTTNSGAGNVIQFCANGFKCMSSDDLENGSSDNMIYMAWAESPVSNMYGAQANAWGGKNSY